MPLVNTFLPPKDADLAQWCANFAAKIATGFASYGLTTGQASAFGTLSTNFISALTNATNVSTRTKSTVAAKNAARALAITSARALAQIVQNFPATTNTQRNDLQLTVKDRHPSPIGAPVTAPILTITGLRSLAFDLRFADVTTPASRSKPAGVVALQVFRSTGTTPPTSVAGMTLAGTYTQNSMGPNSRAVEVSFDPADAGHTGYLIGRWINRRGEVGPISVVTQATVPA